MMLILPFRMRTYSHKLWDVEFGPVEKFTALRGAFAIILWITSHSMFMLALTGKSYSMQRRSSLNTDGSPEMSLQIWRPHSIKDCYTIENSLISRRGSFENKFKLTQNWPKPLNTPQTNQNRAKNLAWTSKGKPPSWTFTKAFQKLDHWQQQWDKCQSSKRKIE